MEAKKVIDIRTDEPRLNDCFLVDSNVWIYLTDPKASISNKNRTGEIYESYLKKCRKRGYTLYWSPLSLSEIAHSIERRELEAYNTEQRILNQKEVKLKEFRSDPQERERVIQDIESCWHLMVSFGPSLDFHINHAEASRAMNHIKECLVDGYDAFFLTSMHAKGVSQIITHDNDFLSVPGIEIFTCNITSVESAQRWRRLFER